MSEPEHVRPDALIEGMQTGTFGAAKDVPPRHPNPGHCAACGVKLDDGRQWYCPEHRGQAKRTRGRKVTPSSSRSATAERLTSSSRPRVTAIPGKVSDTAATNTLAKLLVIVFVILLHYRLRRAGIPDPAGERADALAPTNQQAKDMVAPFARMSNSSPIGSRIIGPISRNEDWVMAAYASWEWYRNMEAFFEKEKRGHMAPVIPIREPGAGGSAGGDAPPAPVTHASDQVIIPEHGDFAPPGFHAVPEPLTLGDDGTFGGGYMG